MPDDRLLEAHREWIGYVQPVGLLVAPAALAASGVLPDANIAPVQEQLAQLIVEDDERPAAVADFPTFAKSFLGWADGDIAGADSGPELPAELGAKLVEYAETLRPRFAVPAAGGGEPKWQILIAVEPAATDFDKDLEDDGHRWVATPQARFERLLRETGVPAGLLTNGASFRLVYAPRGETSGFATFNLADMLEVAGRPMLAAFHMLLQVQRLIGPPEQRLVTLLAESRSYQERVSTELAEQVLAALHELLRGLAAADTRRHRTLIVDLARTKPDHLYSGLLTALMRLVFILYAEDRDLFPRDPVWVQHYSLAELFKRLRDDAALYPDTMDDRYGAWAQLVALWRLIYGGGRHGSMTLVARRGRLFDPDRFPFLEGRAAAADAVDLPPVSDGVVWRMLQRLMVLHGERLSYRTLDVEQIGSVYQAVMGFTIELTTGRSVAIKPPKRGGAAATVDLEKLFTLTPGERAGAIKEQTDRKLSPGQRALVVGATSLASLEEALDSIVDRSVTPTAVLAGVPVLQPTDERRKSGSHYTPRALTEPIVREALRPQLARLGAEATPAQILDLKVLDPAVGSGAFLVEAIRQLADALVLAWTHHGGPPKLPADEDALLHARRLVAQRCIYGVDRNEMAADLAKLSLWLATLAKDHEFTFLDHAIRHGDALVGLFNKEISAIHWEPTANVPFVAKLVAHRISQAEKERKRIREASEDTPEHELRPWLERADSYLKDVKLIGDAVIAAFFAGSKSRQREEARQGVLASLGAWGIDWQERLGPHLRSLPRGLRSVYPFHWQLQFPEVFQRENPGFDLIVGNPPFAGKNTIINGNADHYLDWLQGIHEGAHGNADLVAHFFRRAYTLLRNGGSLGFIATNTIRQGDTRSTGLRWIREHDGIIYAARRRYKWPGEAAVIVSVLHIAKGQYLGAVTLDGRPVEKITAFLFDQGGDQDPKRLEANAGKSFQGSIVLGVGFSFNDADTNGVASPLSSMRELIERTPRNRERIFPYIGGEEVNNHPEHEHSRYITNFEDFPLRRESSLPSWTRMTPSEQKRCRTEGVVPRDYLGPVASDWSELLEIIRRKVKPIRDGQNRDALRNRWWQYAEKRPGLYHSIGSLDRVLVRSQVSKTFAFTFLPNGMVFDQRLVVFAYQSFWALSVVQSRIHETWSRAFGSSLKDDFTYTPTDCFETFPLPTNNGEVSRLETAGALYFEYRAAMMKQANEGMTESYNRFNDPNENSSAIVELRRLHAEMDRAVLDAYGWTDIQPEPVFEREWEDEDGNGPWRYRWPEPVRDVILARLLELNAERTAEEARQGQLNSQKRPSDLFDGEFRLTLT